LGAHRIAFPTHLIGAIITQPTMGSSRTRVFEKDEDTQLQRDRSSGAERVLDAVHAPLRLILIACSGNPNARLARVKRSEFPKSD
jgi:hypothetical protein